MNDRLHVCDSVRGGEIRRRREKLRRGGGLVNLGQGRVYHAAASPLFKQRGMREKVWMFGKWLSAPSSLDT